MVNISILKVIDNLKIHFGFIEEPQFFRKIVSTGERNCDQH